jgi:hypothetical protein
MQKLHSAVGSTAHNFFIAGACLKLETSLTSGLQGFPSSTYPAMQLSQSMMPKARGSVADPDPNRIRIRRIRTFWSGSGSFYHQAK